jgi:hypothetical protein
VAPRYWRGGWIGLQRQANTTFLNLENELDAKAHYMTLEWTTDLLRDFIGSREPLPK